MKTGDWLKHHYSQTPLYFLYLGQVLSDKGIIHRLSLTNGSKIEVGNDFLSRLELVGENDNPKMKADYDPNYVPPNRPLVGGGGGKAAGVEPKWESVTMTNPDSMYDKRMKKTAGGHR